MKGTGRCRGCVPNTPSGWDLVAYVLGMRISSETNYRLETPVALERRLRLARPLDRGLRHHVFLIEAVGKIRKVTQQRLDDFETASCSTADLEVTINNFTDHELAPPGHGCT